MSEPFKIEKSESKVDLWATDRLPFEPRDWKADMRTQLRRAISAMRKAVDGEVLEAKYSSLDRSRCDVENVLCYNVGLTPFFHVTHHGFTLERIFSDTGIPEPFRHHCIYQISDSARIVPAWHKSRTVAKWAFAGTGGYVAPERVWFACKSGSLECNLENTDVANLAVTIELTGSAAKRVNPLKVVKPLVDGLLSALHSYNGKDITEVAARIAHRLNVLPLEVEKLLLDEHHSVLGSRSVVHRFGNGVQWNPADDRCVLIDVRAIDGDFAAPLCCGTLSACEPRWTTK